MGEFKLLNVKCEGSTAGPPLSPKWKKGAVKKEIKSEQNWNIFKEKS